MNKYVLNAAGEPVVEHDVLVWGRWFQDNDAARVIGKTQIGGARVSTVFLGLDHNFTHGAPVLFETMVFWDGHALDSEQERYCTRMEAVAGHERWCQRVADAQEAAR